MIHVLGKGLRGGGAPLPFGKCLQMKFAEQWQTVLSSSYSGANFCDKSAPICWLWSKFSHQNIAGLENDLNTVCAVWLSELPGPAAHHRLAWAHFWVRGQTEE